jgi:hypothetical protein
MDSISAKNVPLRRWYNYFIAAEYFSALSRKLFYRKRKKRAFRRIWGRPEVSGNSWPLRAKGAPPYRVDEKRG